MIQKAEKLRAALIAKLKQQGYVYSAAIETSLLRVPREHFADWLSLEDAYADKAFRNPLTEADSSISQPSAIAIMLESFNLKIGMNVLEIGAGTGYNAALMAHVVSDRGKITSLDIEPELIEKARSKLKNYTNIQVHIGDGALGFLPNAPYDRIVATVGFWDVPLDYLTQLKPEGKLILPLYLGGEPHDYVLVSLLAKGDHFQGYGLANLRMVQMRGINAPKTERLEFQNGSNWQGLVAEKLAISIYPAHLAPPLEAAEKHIFKPGTLTVLGPKT